MIIIQKHCDRLKNCSIISVHVSYWSSTDDSQKHCSIVSIHASRQKYHSGQDRPNGLNRSSDSTSLSALLERARNTFNSSGHHSSNSSSHLTSDHDSGVMNTAGGDASLCDEVTPPPVMSPIVQSYIAGLQDSDQGWLLHLLYLVQRHGLVMSLAVGIRSQKA